MLNNEISNYLLRFWWIAITASFLVINLKYVLPHALPCDSGQWIKYGMITITGLTPIVFSILCNDVNTLLLSGGWLLGALIIWKKCLGISSQGDRTVFTLWAFITLGLVYGSRFH